MEHTPEQLANFDQPDPVPSAVIELYDNTDDSVACQIKLAGGYRATNAQKIAADMLGYVDKKVASAAGETVQETVGGNPTAAHEPSSLGSAEVKTPLSQGGAS